MIIKTKFNQSLQMQRKAITKKATYDLKLQKF